MLSFVGAKKVLALNRTNFDAVADATGEDDTDNWPGRQIELYPTKTQLGNKTVDCIRVRPPAQPKPPKLQQASAPPLPVDESNPPPVDDMADDIPWLQ